MAEPTAGEVMTREVIAVQAQAPLREIAELLERHRISGVPVVDGDGGVLGVVSEADLIDAEKRRARYSAAVRLATAAPPAGVGALAAEEGERLTAAEVMTRRVVTLPESATLRDVAEEMVTRHINRVPITREGRLVGIITRADVLRAVAAGWRSPR